MTRALALVLALAGVACAGPIVEGKVQDVDPKMLAKIAVAPFTTSPEFTGGNQPDVASANQGPEAAAVVTRIASEAFAAAGLEVIPASDVVQVFEAAGQPVPRDNRAAFAVAAAREFGATALLSGTVYRYRERSGGELGTTQPASVGVELVLQTAPGGRRLWTARFDHTQQPLSQNALVAPRYPGAGTRWLTAAELTRWGLDSAAKEVASQRTEQQ
jgi:hypothetical protein